MRAARNKKWIKISGRQDRFSLPFFLASVIFAATIWALFIGIAMGDYTPVTNTCISCHNDTGFPLDTDMNGVATPYKRPHNNSVMCEQCHGTNPHNVTYIQPDGSLGNRSTAATCLDCHQTGLPGFTSAPIIPDPLKHSSNIANGSIWGTYWASELFSCIYCHGDTKHDIIALGKIDTLRQDTNNTKNGSLTATTWCADCHYSGSNTNYLGNSWSPAPPTITSDNTGKPRWVNHSGYLTGGYKDSICKSCHTMNGTYSATSLNYSHSLDEGRAGNPNCIECHDLETGLNAPAGINFTAANASVHAGINSINATSRGYASIIGSCWACHDSDGNVTSGHPDRYKSPKKCDDCHLGTGSFNSSAYNAITVSQHYYGGNIKAGNSTSNISSCINCHENVSEMILPNNDPDTGSFAGDGVRLTGGNRSFYHYGRPRPDIRTGNKENCYYCHQNLSTSFQDAMQKPNVSSFIYNHTAGSFPDCSICHGSGLIHNSTLSKPALTSSFCLGCHRGGIGAARPIPAAHNSTMACWTCHQDPNGTMFQAPPHGMMIPQSNGTYQRYDRGTPANCTSCHVYNLFNTSPNITVGIPALNHSTSPSAGRKWGNYWDNTSMITACYFCHQNELHRSTSPLLGNVSLVQGSNTLNNPDLANSTWCGNCHYALSPGYNGSAFSIPPPEILNKSGAVPAFASDGTQFFNHSDIGNYNDNHCKSCHGSALSNLTVTTLNFSHSVAKGGGGPNCIGCHGTGGTAGPGRLINVSAISSTEAIHSNLNSGASTTLPAENKKCWACHGNGSEPSGHPTNYRTPYRCPDCHIPGAGQNLNFTPGVIPEVSQHYWNGTTIRTTAVTTCYNCHNKSEMMLGSVDPDGPASVYGGANGGNNSSSHYGRKRTDLRAGSNENCYYCHQNASTSFQDAMQKPLVSSFIYNHTAGSFPDCSICHGSGLIHNSTLSKPALTSSFCLGCHQGGIGAARPIPAAHNSTMACWTCHQDPNGTMFQAPPHGMMIPQSNGTYQRYDRGTPANCTSCHVYNLFNTSPNITVGIPALNHSTSPSAGRKWGNYWDNTSMITACYFCHQNELHRSTSPLLGNVSLVQGSNTLNNPDLANSTWCGNCHYALSPGYNGSAFSVPPPEILNKSGAVPAFASDGTQFFNHSDIGNYNDNHCKNCHGSVLSATVTTLNFSHSVGQGGGGPNCISCHNITGTGAPLDRRIDASAIKQGVHKNLNHNATSSLQIDAINKACWACHGDGSEPTGHPQRYKNPRKCSSNDCHSLSQSVYGEPMVYSHFRNASLNNNPENATNYNVTTSQPCSTCHINSLVRKDANSGLALVSHYGSRDNLVDSFNCRYCHLDKDNSEDWGNATLINRNRTSLIELEKERNKLKVSEGEKLYLGEGYFLRLVDISDKRGDARLQLLKGSDIVDEFLLGVGTQYKYEKEITIDNSTFKTPVITLNITSIFKGGSGGFIQFKGFRMRKLHTERETRNNTACYACHLYRYFTEKQSYQVIDRESKVPDDIIYYANVFADFNSENKSKVYFNDEEYIFKQLNSDPGKFISSSSQQKYLKEGETWNITDNYYLKLNEVTTDSQEAWLTLMINGTIVESDMVKKGSEFRYTPGVSYKDYTETNVTVFTARIDAISQGKPNFIILKDVKAISPAVMKTTANTTLLGYNASWFEVSDTFMVGRIPENLHSPNLKTDQRNWADCVMCHDSSKHLKIANLGAISSRLGKHSKLNLDAPNETILSDSVDRACWACHTEGKEPGMHSPTYIKPRNCKSCHAFKEKPSYGAIDISDELHASETRCETCHISDSHNVIRFEVSPVIKEPQLSPTIAVPGETLKLAAEANAGYRMKIRAAEYFVDSMGGNRNGTPLKPADGAFDSQKEEIAAEINTTGLPEGEHVIYIHAMERNNRWGVFYPVSFKLSEKIGLSDRIRDSTRSAVLSVFKGKNIPGLSIIFIIIALIIAYFVVSRRRF